MASTVSVATLDYMWRLCGRKRSLLLVLLLVSVLLLQYWIQPNASRTVKEARVEEREGPAAAVAAAELSPGQDASHPEARDAEPSRLPKSGCGRVDVSVLFLMRIAKCASTSLVHVMKALSKRNKFLFTFNSSGAYNWRPREIGQVTSILQEMLSRARGLEEFGVRKLVVYARHMYYIDFPSLPPFTYVTFVRDPVLRVASSYYYYHFNPLPALRNLIPPQHRGRGLGECVRLAHEGCTPNLLTKYFCGAEPYCSSGSAQAVARAKQNMRRGFAVVGVVEMMEPSMALLARRLPRVFEGVSRSLPETNIGSSSHPVSEEDEHTIRLMNRADLELYQYAADLLQEQLKQCGLPPAVEPG